ncbi:MAG: TPM domain-containing protein, partial [Lachnospiraceae bacterium]|nr:TPM domain-containing protein [Lachnospiraceae bacterium]
MMVHIKWKLVYQHKIHTDHKAVMPFLSCVMLFLCLWFFPLNAHADGESPYTATWENPETGYQIIIEDDADLLSEEEETQLAAKMQEITAYGNAAFKSVSYNNYSASYFAGLYYHEIFLSESGTLFLIDMDNREIYIFSDGAIYKPVT